MQTYYICVFYVNIFLNFFGMPHLATYILFLFNYLMNQDWVQESILARLWHHFHLALDEIRTHNLPIVSRVCWQLDRTFVLFDPLSRVNSGKIVYLFVPINSSGLVVAAVFFWWKNK